MVNRRACLWAVLVVALAGTAEARPTDPRDREAHKACLVGQYRHGIELLTELYLETKDPVYIYNQGRCFQQNALHDEAVTRFREYLRLAKGLSPAEAADVHQLIRESEQARDANWLPPPPITVAPPAVSPPAVRADPGNTTLSPEPFLQGQTPLPPPPPPPLRKTGIALVAVGAVAVAAAVGAGIYVHALSGDQRDQYDAAKDQHAQSLSGPLKAVQWTGYLVGAVGIGAGAVLLVSPPQTGSGQVALGWRGRF